MVHSSDMAPRVELTPAWLVWPYSPVRWTRPHLEPARLGAAADQEQLAVLSRQVASHTPRDDRMTAVDLHDLPSPDRFDVGQPRSHERFGVSGRHVDLVDEVHEHDRLIERIARAVRPAVDQPRQAEPDRLAPIGVAAERDHAAHSSGAPLRAREMKRQQRSERDAKDTGLAPPWQIVAGKQCRERRVEIVERGRHDSKRGVVGQERREHEHAGRREDVAEPIHTRISGTCVVQPRCDDISPIGVSVGGCVQARVERATARTVYANARAINSARFCVLACPWTQPPRERTVGSRARSQ